ncbi:uncharacterized protein LOC111872078, partial [Cryptotermes secundus]|uniref:uncharacterized protein LOC111872078 n=1 Tax=Cryptotermes secundus TaxID=105785 RepID=UPI000CD7C52C
SCIGLKDVRVNVPAAILRGGTATLYCHFDLEGDSLYSVKWYKGRREFYRFTPKEDPAMKIFPIFGLEVEQGKSNATQLTLRQVQLSLSGRYSCEVSADAPSFHTALVSGDMDIVETPRGRPVISGIRHRYRADEILHGNCSSSWSKPAAKLTWFVNGNPPPTSNLVIYPVIRERDGERESSYLGLKMVVKPHHFSNGRLKIRCSATIHDIYYQSTEKSVEEERPRGMLHGTLTAGGGAQYIPAPSPSTDLPPSGHRFDPDTVVQQNDVSTSGGCRTTIATMGSVVPSSPLALMLFLFTVR